MQTGKKNRFEKKFKFLRVGNYYPSFCERLFYLGSNRASGNRISTKYTMLVLAITKQLA